MASGPAPILAVASELPAKVASLGHAGWFDGWPHGRATSSGLCKYSKAASERKCVVTGPL